MLLSIMYDKKAERPASEIWETVKGALQVQVNKPNYDTWIKDTVGLSFNQNLFVVGTPKAFAKEWLELRLYSLIHKNLINVIGRSIEVQFEICTVPEKRPAHARDSAKRGAAGMQSSLELSCFNPRYTFGDFVVGNSNRLAFSAALGAAEEPGSEYNPLYIYGASGLGKTHLAHALGNEAVQNGLNVAYASGEQFTNEFVSAIKAKTVDHFRQRYMGAQVFIIEDIQFLMGKHQTQTSLYHIMDELYQNNRQLVITGNQAPHYLDWLKCELASRLEWGLVTKVQNPDHQTSLNILRAKAEQLNISIGMDTLSFLAGQRQTDVRKLEGLLKRVAAYSKMTCRPLTLELAREALQLTSHIHPERNHTPGLHPLTILNAVADHFNITVESLQNKKRASNLVMARQIAIYLVREKARSPLQDIGNLLGGRDHSTIQRGYQRISALASSDSAVRDNIEAILHTISSK